MSVASELPKLHPDRYEEIVQELLARARIHNPEWTNLSESDPGVTILELFAYLTAQLAAQANEIPERNRRKFLSLLGIPLQPAMPARGFAVFQNDRGPLKPVVAPPNLEVRAGPIPFRTQSGVEVLPVEARLYYKRPDTRPPADPLPPAAPGEEELPVRFYRTVEMAPPVPGAALPALDLLQETVDGALWIALLARTKEEVAEARKVVARQTLTLGVLPATGDERMLPPKIHQFKLTQREVPLRFEMATAEYDRETGMPLYQQLQAKLSANILREPGLVNLRLPDESAFELWPSSAPDAGQDDLPPLLADPKTQGRLVTWLRMRLPSAGASHGIAARLSWVGINADMVEQLVPVESEFLGQGTGEPDQSFTLVNKNVRPGSVHLMVGGQPWQEIDDLTAAGPEVTLRQPHAAPGGPRPYNSQPSQVFTLDPASGEIRFGNGLRGARPRERIQASYTYGGGRAGNVDVGALNKAPTLQPGLTVRNPVPTWGGLDAETPEEAERQVISYLRHQDRLVTAEDFGDILRRVPGVAIGRVEVLPLYHPYLPDVLCPGVVTILALPGAMSEEAPPVAEGHFLKLISEYLESRRLITTELFVKGPIYRPLQVSVGVELAPGQSSAPVREAIVQGLRRFLSPLGGGRDGRGWPLNQWVRSRELWTEVSRIPGVAYVREVYLGDENGVTLDEVPITGLELPWLQRVDVQQGDPTPLTRVSAPPPSRSRPKLLPVVPREAP